MKFTVAKSVVEYIVGQVSRSELCFGFYLVIWKEGSLKVS